MVKYVLSSKLLATQAPLELLAPFRKLSKSVDITKKNAYILKNSLH